MSRILRAAPNDDYALLVDITVEEEAICWPEPVPGEKSIMPLLPG